MRVAGEHKFRRISFCIADLWRHKAEPPLKFFAPKGAVFDLGSNKSDAVQLNDKNARKGIRAAEYRLGDTTRDLFRMNGEKQTSPELGDKLQIIKAIFRSRCKAGSARVFF